MRIVTLLPSATEIVCLLGLADDLVGVTHECDYPPHVLDLPKVTTTCIAHDASSREIDTLVRKRLTTNKALYSLDIDVLARVQPDLLVTQALCDVCAVAEDEVTSAAKALPGSPQVVNLEPMCLAEVLDCITLIGNATGRIQAADTVVAKLRQRVEAIAARSANVQQRPRVMVMEWIDPPFCCGHWTPELVRLAGGQEVIGAEGQASRGIEWESIVDADPEVLLIACCGFDIPRTAADLPILQAYPGYESLSCVKHDRVFIVDGSAYFSRPGPRLVDSLEILGHALHSELHALPHGLPAAVHVETQ